ncbi:hypothetical protein AU375_02170 [Methylobacterium radiotolerans]|nr:hypothetical protein AU375_02170 [Methylobacterium radiotolerans]
MREVLKNVLPDKNINIHSIRGGDVPSTHKIIFFFFFFLVAGGGFALDMGAGDAQDAAFTRVA